MLRTTLAGLRAHARRMLATALAVIAGVGFVAGTLIFTDTTKAAYFETFARLAKNVDVSVRAESGTGLSEQQLRDVRAVPGVSSADGRVVEPVAMLGANGRVITNFGRVGWAMSTGTDPRLRGYDVTGRVPEGPGEALVDDETAAHQRFRIGDSITVLGRDGSPHPYRLVGVLDLATSPEFSGSSVVGLPVADIRALTGRTGYDEIVVSARSGVPAGELASRVGAVVPATARVRTGDERRTELANQATQTADAVRLALLIFGAISLVVATFVIYNTFAILLTQRIRETALLRCVGATRRQIFSAVVTESFVVGLVGGAAGIVVGLGVAAGLLVLLNKVVHAGIPGHGVVLTGTPIVAGFAIAIMVTVGAALLPAIRATRTSPLAALRDQPTAKISTVRGKVGRIAFTVLVGAVGLLLTVTGWRDQDSISGTLSIVAGGVVTFLAILGCAPLYIGPLVAAVGSLPGRLLGTTARLATANARRNPGRTAVTTASLMIGVGLMSLSCVLIASVRETANEQLIGHYPVDYVVTPVRYPDGEPASIPPRYAQALRARPEFGPDRVAETRVIDVEIEDNSHQAAAIDPAALRSLIRPEMISGSIAELRAGTAIVSESLHQPVGSVVAVSAERTTVRLTVVGIARTTVPGTEDVQVLLSWDQMIAVAGPGDDSTVMAKAAPGVSALASRDALESLAEQYPLVEVNSLADLTSDLDNAVNQLIGLFGGLLGTAVLIALFGIANTLSLSVVERTRESATVRALGLTRGQLRATLLIEALVMGVVGALVGVGYGLIYGYLLVSKAFGEVGATIVLPWSWLAGLIALAALAATLAAVLPARRAARASIVSAMSET